MGVCTCINICVCVGVQVIFKQYTVITRLSLLMVLLAVVSLVLSLFELPASLEEDVGSILLSLFFGRRSKMTAISLSVAAYLLNGPRCFCVADDICSLLPL